MKVIVGFLSAVLRSLLNLPSENCKNKGDSLRSLSFGVWSKSITTTSKVFLKPPGHC